MPRSGGEVRLPRASRGGQAILEYVLVFMVVAAAILGTQVLAKRGIQATLKVAADDLSSMLPPKDPDDPLAAFPREAAAQFDGLLYDAGADTRNRRGELVVVPGFVDSKESEVTRTDTSAIRMGATAGGGSLTEEVAVSSLTTGTSTASVVAEVKP